VYQRGFWHEPEVLTVKTRCGQLDKTSVDESSGDQEGSDERTGNQLSNRWARCGVTGAVRSWSFMTPHSQDKKAAERQAKLEKVLAEEHERGGKHEYRIELPDQRQGELE
jgi:hypothetical protein